MLDLKVLPGWHLRLNCCSGLWDSARRRTTWTVEGNTHSWYCCQALSRQIPCQCVEGCQMLGVEFLPGWHVHLNCCSGLWASDRRTTTRSAEGNTHSWCCCQALSRQIPCQCVEGCQMLGLKILPGWHVYLNCCSGLFDAARGRTVTQPA
jgi:hypothetical protein